MSVPPSKRRRVELTLEDRINLIKDSEAQPKPTLVVSVLVKLNALKLHYI